MEAREYDIAIIGGGPGGYVGALRAAQLGARVAIIEKDRLGGTCLNRGCIPTKALVRSVECLEEVKRASEFGVDVAAHSFDFARMMERKDRVVDTLVSGIEELVKAARIDLYQGTGRLLSPRRVAVNGQEIAAKNIIIATGSVSARVPVPGLDLPRVLTSDDILELTEMPQSLAVIGGGVIGMEFASIFNFLGTEVTVIEMLPNILPPVDDEIARRFRMIARRQGITINVGSPVRDVREGEKGLRVFFGPPDREPQSIEAEKVLLAVGRSPYTEGLGLAELGIAMNRRAVAVNDRLETNVEGVYAIGDVIGGIMLAHVASYEGEVAVENALGRNRAADYRVVPGCIFTSPEIATVGMMEQEVREAGINYKVSRFPFSALGRAQALGETEGTVKMICEAETSQVLGVHILGPHATDLIGEAAAVMHAKGTAQDIVHTIHAHPTLPEAMLEAAMGQFEGSLHVRRV